MSGRKQHHIPQSLLRGFETPSTGKKTQVWVFSKRKKFKSPTEDVAAERHFYSELSNDGTQTLDDKITAYEMEFANQLSLLRAVPNGADADASIAAEVIAHLTIRNAHLRRSFAGGFRMLVDRAADLFCNEENIRAMLGVDGRKFTPATASKVDELLTEDPRFAASGLPREVVHKIAFMAMRENFSSFVANNLPFFQIVLERIASDLPEQMRAGHNQVLSTGLAPDGRTAALAALNWTVQPVPETGMILPDCVALGIEGEALPQPLITSDLSKLTYVMMPLTSHRMLVGSRRKGDIPSLVEFNQHAATCSHDFFISHRDGDDLDALIPIFGARARQTIDDAVAEAFEGFKKERNLAPTSSDNANEEISNTIPSITAEKIAAVIDGIVHELRPMMALDRLDGFTFAEDYDTALRDLDTGFENRQPLESTNKEYGIGVARTPIVLREGVVKCRVVARIWIATDLISDDNNAQQIALHMLISQLAHVACVQLLDEALPGFYLRPLPDSYEAFLYPCIASAWSGYFAARASAIFNPDSETRYRQLVLDALKFAQNAIPPARHTYYLDHDMDKLMGVALPAITAFLNHIGQLLGHCDGLQRSAFEDELLETTFENSGLRAWADFFQNDLALVWDRRGQWNSIEEFLVLNRHAERLLWQFGLVPWKTEEGLVWVQVASDTGAVQEIKPS